MVLTMRVTLHVPRQLWPNTVMKTLSTITAVRCSERGGMPLFLEVFMVDHKSAKMSADKAQAMVGHAVTYHNGGAMSAVPDKAPEIDENDWIDQNASRDKMI